MPTKISLQPNEQLREFMRRETTKAFHAVLLNGMRRFLDHLLSVIPPYPPTRPGQRYRRTLTLGRRFSVGVDDAHRQNFRGWIGTDVSYAPWVISEEKTPSGAGPQAWMHAGRWWTLHGVARDNLDDAVNYMMEDLGKWFEKFGSA